MIPNVHEETLQTEFNLKQIDAPMPEAPWVKLCAHGIAFTDQLTQDSNISKSAHRRLSAMFGQSDQKPETKKEQTNLYAKGMFASKEAGIRLVDNLNKESVSDLNKISLIEDSRIIEDVCDKSECNPSKMVQAKKSNRLPGCSSDVNL